MLLLKEWLKVFLHKIKEDILNLRFKISSLIDFWKLYSVYIIAYNKKGHNIKMRTYTTIGVMKGAGEWGPCYITNGNNNILVKLTDKAIFKNGTMKKMYRKRISKDMTINDCMWLYNNGCTVTMA